MTTFYTCPRCGMPYVTGYLDDEGQEHWTCQRKVCGAHERPVGAPRPRARAPHLPPAERRRLRRIAAAEAAAPITVEALASSAVQVRPAAPRHSPIRMAVAVGLAAAALVAFLALAHPFGASPTATGPVVAPQRSYPLVAPQGGYRVVCQDGWISYSGGRPGACSHHGGIRR